MTDPSYTPADVTRYGEQLHEAAHGPHGEGCDTPDYCRTQVRRQFDRYAEVLLRLADADGRFLPPHRANTRGVGEHHGSTEAVDMLDPTTSLGDVAMPKTVTLTITLDSSTAELLGKSSAQNFYAEQADRFEIMSSEDAPQPGDAVFDGGTMTWCATASDALLLVAYEEAGGFRATLLWDLNAAAERAPAIAYVVLSSRPWRH